MRKFYSKKLKLLKRNKVTSERKMQVKIFKNLENQTTEDKIQFKEKSVSQNKWLYPSEEFGQMEKGIVIDSRTYNSENYDNENDFEIL